MSNDLPKLAKTSYRFDVDAMDVTTCNGEDLFFNDSVEISSSGDRVSFVFNNEQDLPTWFDLHFNKKSDLHWVEYPNDPKDRRAVPSTREHYTYVIEALKCAVSLEQDAAKKSALQQVLNLVKAAQNVHAPSFNR